MIVSEGRVLLWLVVVHKKEYFAQLGQLGLQLVNRLGPEPYRSLLDRYEQQPVFIFILLHPLLVQLHGLAPHPQLPRHLDCPGQLLQDRLLIGAVADAHLDVLQEFLEPPELVQVHRVSLRMRALLADCGRAATFAILFSRLKNYRRRIHSLPIEVFRVLLLIPLFQVVRG